MEEFEEQNILAFTNQSNDFVKLAQKQAVKEFAEKLKSIIHERDYVQGYAEIGLIEEINELLKEYEKWLNRKW